MLVITGAFGQLCNRLFAFANVVAFAARHGMTVANLAFGPYRHFFASTQADALCRFPARKGCGNATAGVVRLSARLARRLRLAPCIQIGEKEKCWLDAAPDGRDIARLAKGGVILLNGLYFLNRDGLGGHSQLLRDFFRPAPAVEETVRRFVCEARQGADVLVGMHIRQGDYKTHGAGKYYFSTEEYTGLMVQVKNLFEGKRVRFVVCSDTPQAGGAFGGLDTAPGPGRSIEDLYVLAACDYIAGVPSTFSMWASFYGGVPRYEHNPRERAAFGLDTPPPKLEDFRVHLSGDISRVD